MLFHTRALVVAALVASAASQCLKTFSNASFDLSKLRLPGGAPYLIRDNRNNNATLLPSDPDYDSYVYFIAICDSINFDSFQPLWKDDVTAACRATIGAGGKVSTGPSAALQYSPFDVDARYKCFRLAGDVRDHPGNETWSLIEPSNPSRGVQVRYEGGDLCCKNNRNNCANPQPRTVELQFFCKDDATNVFDLETVLEYDSCQYRIWLDTAYGCPTQCSITDGHLCNGHGICDFDGAIGSPRCFCNEGWEGDGCAIQTVVNTGISVASVVIILVSIILVLLLAILYFLWQRIRGLRLDPSAYKSLTGSPEEDMLDEEEKGAAAIYDD